MKYMKNEQNKKFSEQFIKLILNNKELPVKMCCVHNSKDLEIAMENGIRWVGIQLTNIPDEYISKLSMNNDTHGVIVSKLMTSFPSLKRLRIPWAEIDSIKHMISNFSNAGINFVFLFNINDVYLIETSLRFILEGFCGEIIVQLQTTYNGVFVKELKEKLEKCYSRVVIIQTIDMSSVDSGILLNEVNNDVDINYVLFDSSIKGGTGIETDNSRLALFVSACHKEFFVAGGINSKNVVSKFLFIKKLTDVNFMFDIETGLETSKAFVCVDSENRYICLRKSVKKTKDLCKKLFNILKIEN